MLHSVETFGSFSVIESVKSPNKITGDAAYAFKLDAVTNFSISIRF